jgi:hypothetical protein
MNVIVGAPVANRAWALPDYYRLLAAQDRPPDGVLLVHSGHIGDDTWAAARRCAREYGLRTHMLYDHAHPHPRHDPARFGTLAMLRNKLLAAARILAGADIFVSLDTDVMLDNPATISRLLELLDDGWDTASPVTWLHPHGEGSWAWNAGWWTDRSTGPGRGWNRRTTDDIPWGQVIRIDIPMAAIAMNARVFEHCRYRWHESGEDLGFAQDLQRRHARCAWDTGLKARHVWDQAHLDQVPV